MKVCSFHLKSGSVTDLQNPFAGSDAHLVLAFGAPELMADPRNFQALSAQFPQAVIAGSTTAGEIFQGQFEDDSIPGVAISFDATVCRAATRRHNEAVWQEPAALGADIAAELAAPDLRLILLFTEGIHLRIDPFLEGLNGYFHNQPAPVVVGGAAGDSYHFLKTSVLSPEGLLDSGIVAVGLYGDRLEVGVGISNSFTSVSPVINVTRASGYLVQEIDHQPAFEVFRSLLRKSHRHDDRIPVVDYCLLMETEDGQPLTTRSITEVNETTGEMHFVGEVKPGPCRIVDFSDNYDYLRGARRSVETAWRACPGGLALFFSCAGRRSGLGIAMRAEMQEAAGAFPPEIPSLGFYCYGEICSNPASGKAEHFNQSFIATFLREIPA